MLNHLALSVYDVEQILDGRDGSTIFARLELRMLRR